MAVSKSKGDIVSLLGGSVLDHVELSTSPTVTTFTEGTAQTLLTSNSIIFDGTTRVIIEMGEFHSDFTANASGDAFVHLLYEDSTLLGRLFTHIANGTANTRLVAHGKLRRTPSAGTHTYTIKAYKSTNLATFTSGGGAGGTGDNVAAFLRVIRDSSAIGNGGIAGIQNGYAPLDSGILIPHAYIPKTGVGAPGMILLQTQTASSSATLDFTTSISSTYDEYIVEFLSVAPATTGDEFRMRCSTDGGSTWDSTAGRYYHNNTRMASTTLTSYNGGGSATTFGLAHNVDSSVSALSVSGSIRLQPTGSAQRWITGQLHYLPQSSDRIINFVNGDYENGSYNAVRFYYSTGNIASGTIRIYGIPK